MQIKTIISILFFSLILLLCNAKTTFSQSPINAGFVSGIWFSKNNIVENQDIRIYSAIQNNSGFDIKGKVEFYDNETIIGTANFSSVNGRLVEIWTDWKPLKGKHNIYAKIIQAQKSEPGKLLKNIILPIESSSKKEIIVKNNNAQTLSKEQNGKASKTLPTAKWQSALKNLTKQQDNNKSIDLLNNENKNADAFAIEKQKIENIAQKISEITSGFAEKNLIPKKEKLLAKIKELPEQDNNKAKKMSNKVLLATISATIWGATNKTVSYIILCSVILLLVYAIFKLFTLLIKLFQKD